jgi:hypothetical protein
MGDRVFVYMHRNRHASRPRCPLVLTFIKDVFGWNASLHYLLHYNIISVCLFAKMHPFHSSISDPGLHLGCEASKNVNKQINAAASLAVDNYITANV